MTSKICHVTSAHDKYDTRIFHKECKSLAKQGYDTYLLVNGNGKNEEIDNVKIINTGFVPKSRKERMKNSSKYIKQKCLDINADIYHLHDPELFAIVKFLKTNGKKVIFDSHEDYMSTIKDKDWIPKVFRGVVAKLFGLYERYIIKKIDAAIVCYHWTLERYLQYLPKQKVCMILNFPIVADENLSKVSNQCNCISYAGGISAQWCHKNIIKALENIKCVRYILAGDTSNSYASSLKQMDGWKFVDDMGVIPQEDVEKMVYSNSFAGMALLDYITQCKGNIGNLSNTKFFEYMKAGLPLICTDFILWKEIINKEKCGICVNPHNVDEIANAIKYLANNREQAIKMGQNGRKAVIEKYNWTNESEKLFRLYELV